MISLSRRISRPVRAAGALALLSLAAAPLSAQRCLGFPGFSGQPLRIGGTLTTGGNVTTVGGDLAFGQAAGPFGGVSIGAANYDNVDKSALTIGANIGTQIELGTASRSSSGAQLCPIAAIEYQNGPNSGNVDVTGLDLRGGVALGTSLAMTPTIRLAPFGGLSVAYARSTVSSGSFDNTDSQVGGLVDLGAGLVFTNKFTIRPSVTIPIGFDDSDARFGIAVGYNFGGNR